MTARDTQNPATPDFDRLIAAWFDTEARVQEPPDLIERVLVRRRKTRPRSSWLLPERWLPMELTMRRVRVPRLAGSLFILVLVGILIAGALVIAGSRRPIPPPFGPAANGRVAVATSAGDIATVDPLTGATSTIVSGPERDRFPAFSLDGQRIAFVRRVTDGEAVYVVDVNGGALTLLTPGRVAAATMLTWSPDGQRVAFLAGDTLWIAAADGSGARPVDLGMALDAEIEWRPPDGAELVVRGIRDGLAGLFLVRPDGTSRAITPIDGSLNDYLWLSWTPDGKRLAYSSRNAQETHVLTIDGPDTVVQPEGGDVVGFPRFSPDGRRLALMVWQPAGGTNVRVGVVPADDATPTLVQTGPTFGSGIQFEWSPDGTVILATQWETDQPWVLDPGGGPGTSAPWKSTFPDWVEWQRLAR